MNPVVLGAGTPLFDGQVGPRPVRLTGHKVYPNGSRCCATAGRPDAACGEQCSPGRSLHDTTRALAAWSLGSYPLGAPEATSAAILAAVDAEEPPLRVILGGPGAGAGPGRLHGAWRPGRAGSASPQGSLAPYNQRRSL